MACRPFSEPDSSASVDNDNNARTFFVRIEPSGKTFDAPDSLTVLEAAGFAGLRLPRSCRNGTCRTCMCQLKEGRVRYTIEWPGLTREEKAEGLILPCVAIAASDLVIDVPDVVDAVELQRS
ncbi:MAG: 2Fe-2S iron-sulfur cluster binding domain-containing protein [Paraburkholderia sp.]|uniref:2Fe-2S iron-sulfur cluster-binding protein n=1 Tax=Paraburkholderia sp. TaxID=1926495 RepID=UPI00122604A1|nr:2Fe-2S iron-sulfur cluster-binding protein [Paraburkholderia sp.]TAL94777.1 MAG: 2Fe-2S iron-sulfur cluster binding domain-containing protein [Paraburkholderia sp.]